MRATLLIFFTIGIVFTLPVQTLRAQDISGYWQGVLYQEFPYGTVYHPLSMELEQNGTAVMGTSEILWATDPSYYGIMSLAGSFDGSTFSFQELAILDQNPHPTASWCIKQGDLIFDGINQVLEGPWQAPGCYPGTIELHRLTLLSDTIFCQGENVRLEVTGINIRWYSDPALTNLLDTGNVFFPAIVATDTFYVTQTHYGTESPAFQIQVIISAPEFSNILSKPNGCGPPVGTITITASGGIPEYLYAIDGGSFQTDSVFTELQTGIYNLSILDAQGCTASAQSEVFSTPLPIIDSITVLPLACGQDTTTFAVHISGGSGTVLVQLNGSPFQTDTLFTGIPYGQYLIVLMDDATCTDTAMVFIDTLVPPFISSLIMTPPTCDGHDGSISVHTTGGNGPISYALSGGSFQDSSYFNGLSSGQYIIEIKDTMGCMSSASITVASPDKPEIIQATITLPTCGQTNGSMTLDAAGGTPPLSYSLSGGLFQSTSSFSSLAPGTYTAWISDQKGCLDSQIVTIDSTTSLVLDSLNITNAYCPKSTGQIDAFISGGTGIVLMSLNNGFEHISGSFPSLLPGLYKLVIYDEVGCQIDTILTIESFPCNIYIPNSFSPNGDGINDDFRIYGPSHEGAVVTRYTIFDRWGNQIFEQKNFPLDSQLPIWWDGTFRGKPLEESIVIYVIELEYIYGESKLFKGDLHIIR